MLLKMTLLLFTAAAAVKDRQCARIPNALIFVAACNGIFLQSGIGSCHSFNVVRMAFCSGNVRCR